MTKRLRRIPNARHFRFESASVIKAQYFKRSGMRCSPLNAALCLRVPHV
ncbi:acetyltransferase [Vibrio parahaemolyticus]|nr:acetyltransferase [Vibrio parahaemolyticus]